MTMALTYSATLKNLRMAQVLNEIDKNASAATLEIGTTAMGTVLVSIPLAKPSFTLSTDTLTMASMPRSATASATNTAAAARIKEGGGTVVVDGLTVGTTGADINLNSTSVSNGQTVTLTAVSTIKHAT
jgi:hypothetical protein